MRVELINTGTELLLGQVVNTHLPFLARELFPLGLRIERQLTVPDGSAIRDALLLTFQQADIVLVTGGLGPTTDDLTREITAELLELPLQEAPAILESITDRFRMRGFSMTARIARQAQVPRGAIVLPNPNGTAPGLYLRAVSGRNPHLFLLPGPPRELHPMFQGPVKEHLQSILPDRADFVMRILKISGLGESMVEERVGPKLLSLPGLELGYCARPGEVDVRLTGPTEVVANGVAIIEGDLGRHIVARDDADLAATVAALLADQKATIATAESCTGGLIAHKLTNVPGVSEVFVGGHVTYANAAKTRLGVSPDLIASHGAVSEEVCESMAIAAARVNTSTYGVATTGIAGPGGGSPDKPVGLIYIATANHQECLRIEKRFFPLERETFKQMASQAALDLLRRTLLPPSNAQWKDRIRILVGDIATHHADAVVNAANESLAAGSGVCGALFDAAGPALKPACAEIGHCPTGSAVVTTAGRLIARRILHAVAPIWNGGTSGEPELLTSAYADCFRHAKTHNLRTLAFPALGTGVYGYPKEQACRIALETAREELTQSPFLDEIRFICFTPDDATIYRRVIDQLQ